MMRRAKGRAMRWLPILAAPACLCTMALRAHAAACMAAPTASELSAAMAQDRALKTLQTKVGESEFPRYQLSGLDFDTEAKVWIATFRFQGTAPVDYDPWVWIDDHTAQTCVSRGEAVGKCVDLMYPPPKSFADAKFECESGKPPP